MPKRAAEAPLSSETHRVRPDTFSNYRSQVAKLLSQKERTSNHEVTTRHSNSGVGSAMSNVKKDKLNVLLRQCVKNLTPEVDEMQRRVCSMYLYLISQLGNKCPSSSPVGPEESGGESDGEIQLLLKSDPDLVKRKTSLHTNILLSELENMQQKLEGLLDDVVTTCRPMTRGEKRVLMKSIKELPKGDHDRIIEIVRDHCITSGEDFSDKVTVNLENSQDNVNLWRLHYYVGAVNNARKLDL
ncbi:unnamed protein product [Microthlaspi erraticum]|uniref:NET domain-containing protein n=1 Tax=Microthlaspi erraticum TaxID=1685480 RepID=A0A6D2KFS3_9BRAS|nr:unnamed protein product [Microthlaspi erraticum]